MKDENGGFPDCPLAIPAHGTLDSSSFEWNRAVMLEDIVTLKVFQFTFASITHFMVVTSPNDNLFASYLVCIDFSRSRLVQSTAFPVASLVRLFARTARTYTFSVEFLLLAM